MMTMQQREYQQQQQSSYHRPGTANQPPNIGGPVPSAVDSFSSSSGGSASPSLSLRTAEDSLSTLMDEQPQRMMMDAENGQQAGAINLQIFVPELQMQKCLSVPLEQLVWDIKRRLLESLPQPLPQHFNFGLFLPPCDGRAGKFLLEDRPIRDYPFHDCVPYVHLKYKKRVYKMLRLDEKALRSVHSKANLRKFVEAVQQKNAQKVDRLCAQGLDPNFHDPHGETPLTLASGIPGSRQVLVQLVGGGAHLDFRNTEGQTGMHKAAFLSMADNVRTLLELGASPNYRDLIGLTPLYYAMLTTEACPEVAEMLLAEAAELDIVDMHGNTALHQACKNGLAKQVEQLLYYGADINAANVNGNSPLHVCAVNGRVECAQLLLYRGADPTLLNRQGQTAVQVAQIVGHLPVAEVVRGHSAHNIVPFREPPKLNPRRRLSSRQFSVEGSMRRRSLSHCSSSSTIASVATHQQQNRLSSANMFNQQQPPSISPSPSMSSSMADYGTLRRIPAEAVHHQQPGLEPNVPRTLVIPRGPKGFGFILRGARQVDSMQLDFRPSAAIPALQFFEGVDMQGMAMRAGLRPGDFLLEINGVDVRAASHEQVVQLIHQSGDTITLKVITIDVALLAREQEMAKQQQQQIYASSGASTYATLGRRNHSVPRTNAVNGTGPVQQQTGPPPAPPQRNPSTSLSFGRAFTTNNGGGGGSVQFCTADLSSPSQQHQPPIVPNVRPNLPSPIPAEQQQQQSIRCASVKLSRSSAVRRISAAELEHLMVQQGSSQQSMLMGPEANGGGATGPRKFTSVTEMKRRKQAMRANSISDDTATASFNNNEGSMYGLKSCTSSPDLPSGIGQQQHEFRPVLRPKTPPPPPPPVVTQKRGTAAEPPEPEQQPIYASTVVVQAEPRATESAAGPSTSTAPGPPAPPPPPPPTLLLRPSQASSSAQQSRAVNSSAKANAEAGPAERVAAAADCRGVSAEALQSVRLKPVQQTKLAQQPAGPVVPNAAVKDGGASGEKPKLAPMPADFDSDLRSALARRRNKVRGTEEGSGDSSSTEELAHQQQRQQHHGARAVVSIAVGGGADQQKTADVPVNAALSNTDGGLLPQVRYIGGLSLRESVLENVSGAAGKPGHQGGAANKTSTANSHSPPGGFIGTKKDSGYTSSRTSLEPSECGDCEAGSGGHHGPSTQGPSLPVQHRVNVISQQLMMDQSAAPLLPGLAPPKAVVSKFHHQQQPMVRIPPVDYEQSESSQTSTDSGNHTDSEQQPVSSGQQAGSVEEVPGTAEQNTNSAADGSIGRMEQPQPRQQRVSGQFRQMSAADWGPGDVGDWLQDLELGEHCRAFAAVRGADLLKFDRARYTALGVTRIGHRQKMEQSLRSFQRE